MLEKFDTTWFDLKNYEIFKTMSLLDWEYQLQWRYQCYEILYLINSLSMVKDLKIKDFDEESGLLYLAFMAKKIKKGDLKTREDYNPKYSLSSVIDLTCYEIWSILQDDRITNETIDQWRDTFDKEIALQPLGIDNAINAKVSINLFATDKQIKKDFSDWLKKTRQLTNIKSQKKLFSQVDFDYWIEYGVIQYLDLVLIAKIERKKITQPQLARLIFPNTVDIDIDITERLRKVTKKTADLLIMNKIHKSLFAQLAQIGMKIN
jgi:hypothetical protein